MKKSLIAVAVAGAVGAPMTAAQAAEAYGFVNVGIDSVSHDDAGAASSLIFASGSDGSLHMSDTAGTRFGFRGSEDLGNGLTAGYRLEWDMGTDAGGGGSVNEDAGVTTRLANVSLSGDFGMVKMGTQWGALYEYLGWNVYRSDANGGAAWYAATTGAALNEEAYGLRVDNAITYTYGAGGYGSDPFTFTAQAHLQPDTPNNEEAIDALTLAGQAVFGDFAVQVANYSESNESGAEPSLTGVGLNWNAGDLYVGGNFTSTDPDDGGDELEIINILATMDFGGGNSGMAGFGTGDSGDREVDLSTLFLQFNHQLSSATKFYVEFESATVDNAGAGGGDLETSVVSANVKHSF